jgi:DNA-binding CsgD family transcriptional regulator
VRWLLQHADRSDPASRSYARTIVRAGAQVRTTDQIYGHLAIFDHQLALVATFPGDQSTGGMLKIKERHLVSYLAAFHEHAWRLGVPFTTAEDGFDEVAIDNLQRAIMKLMGDGMKDEQVARRLGISVRTCRKHIADLMRRLDAGSRFQAGIRAKESGLFQ